MPLPWTVLETIAHELGALPPAASELAKALAIAEAPMPAAAAARLMGGLDAAWSALHDAGLVADADELRLRHGLVAEAIQARMGPEERAAWHGWVAAALEGGEADRVARHWAAAGELRRAAGFGARGRAPAGAAGATRRAFDCYALAVRDHPAPELLEEAAQTAARLGEYEPMRAWLAAAERAYRAQGRADRAARMLLEPAFDYLPIRRSAAAREEPVERLLADAQAATRDGDPDAAGGLVAAAVAAAASATTAWRWPARRGSSCSRSASPTAGGAAGRRPGAVGGRRRVRQESRLLTIQAWSRFTRGHAGEAIDLFRGAVLINRERPEAVVRTGEIALGDVLILTGALDEGAETLIRAAAALPEAQPLVETVEGYRRFERGEVERAWPASPAAATGSSARSTSTRSGARSPPRTCSTFGC